MTRNAARFMTLSVQIVIILFLGYVSLALAGEKEVQTSLKKQGYVTEIDFTSESSYTLDSIGKVEKLRTLDKDMPHDGYIYGIYTVPLAHTGGVVVELFPNSKFAVIHVCDICPGPEVLWYGSWHEKDGIVSFDVEPSPPDHRTELNRTFFEREYGKFGDFNLFVLADGKAIGKSILVPQSTLTLAPIARYFVRGTVYVDWQKDLDGIQLARAKSEKP